MKINIRSSIDTKNFLRATLVAVILLLLSIIDTRRSFPPISLILSLSTLFLISGWWLWRIINSRTLPKTPITSPLVIFLIIVSISTFYSIDSRRSLDGTLATFSVVLIFFILCDLLISGWDVETFELALIIFVGVLLIIGINKIVNWYWSWYQMQVPDYPLFLLRFRLYGVAAHPNFFAMLIYIVLPFIILKIYNAKSHILRIIWLLWLMLGVINLYFVNSRGGLIATIIVVITTLFWIFWREETSIKNDFRGWIYDNKTFLLSILLAIGVYLILSVTINIISPGISTLHHGSGISAGRFRFWDIAINIIRSYPITGAGLGTYPRFYVEEIPIGQFGWIAPHAHNLFLDITAQIGLIGFIILIWIIFTSLFKTANNKIINRSFITSDYVKNIDLFIASFSGLIGFLVHSIFDVTITTPQTILPIVILLAIHFSSKDFISTGYTNTSKVIRSILFILLSFLLIFLFYSQNKSHTLQLLGIQSGKQNNWFDSVNYLEEAARLDPSMSLYEHQRGYAYASLYLTSNSKDSSSLEQAIVLLENANYHQPKLIPNIVNLAFLLDSAGKIDESLTLLEAIPERSRKSWPITSLYLGMKYESLGKTSLAEQNYKFVLDQDYWLKNSVICERSFICRNYSNTLETDEVDNIHLLAINAIEQNNPDEALEILEKIAINNSPSIIWIDRAAAHIEQGEFSNARYELRIAERLNAINSKETRSYFALTAFRYFMSQSKPDLAISILESVVQTQNASNNYPIFIFQRFGFPNQLLPQLILMESNQYDLQIYKELHQLYSNRGLSIEAEWARNQLEKIIEMKGTKL